jgi:hypothetical protein
MTGDRLLLAGCGILRKEIAYLIRKNNWPLDTHFLDSALHVDFDKLAAGLGSLLENERERNPIIFYGTCHPLMNRMLADAGTFRTNGQNCCEMLLGHELFNNELINGAYFLLEEWALRWDHIMMNTFNTKKLDIIRDIFQGDRTNLLAIRTPCSDDFADKAEAAAEMVGLPLHWLDVSLDNLEAVLNEAITRKRNETP